MLGPLSVSFGYGPVVLDEAVTEEVPKNVGEGPTGVARRVGTPKIRNLRRRKKVLKKVA